MSVLRKLLAAAVGSILIVQSVDATRGFERERELFESDLVRDVDTLGRGVAGALSQAWADGGRAAALRTLEAVERQEPGFDLTLEPAGDAPLDRPSTSYERASGVATARFPVVAPDGSAGVLRVEGRFAGKLRHLRGSALHAVLSAIITAAATTAALMVLGMWLLRRPLRQLAAAAVRIGEGDLDTRVPVTRIDEVGEVARAMDAMRARLRAAQLTAESEMRGRMEAELRAELEKRQRLELVDQLRHADRLATAGTLVSTVMHEIGAPLQVISGRAKMIAARRDDPEKVAEYAGVVREQAERIATLGRSLLDFARKDAGGARSCAVGSAVSAALSLLSPLAHRRKVEVSVRPDGMETTARISEDKLVQVITNLVQNAIDAMPDGGSLEIACEPDPSGVTLVFADTGAGMTEEVRRRIFSPFFTTKPAGEGTGLGLVVVDGIVREAGGRIAVDSAPGRGTTFRVALPPANPDAAKAAGAAEERP